MARVALVLWAAGLMLAAVEAPSWGQSLRVERSLPVVGKPCRLSVRSAAPLSDGAQVTFRVEALQGEVEPWTRAVEATAGIAETVWAPATPGAYRVTARVDGEDLTPAEVFATETPLHFNCWGAPPEQRYLTSVLTDGAQRDLVEHWLDRGVLPLGWGSGALDYYDRVEQWLEEYRRLPPGLSGLMIDECWGAGAPPHRDELAAEALLRFRAERPDLFQAIYCITVGREKMRDLLAQADLVLVELYRADFRSYPDLSSALQPFVETGLADHTIPVLGVGPSGDTSTWITTEAELRSQIAWIRATTPECPGVGIFPGLSAGLSEAFDRAVYDYYLGPALLHRNGLVRNIGQLAAEDVRLTLPDGAAGTIERIWPGGQAAMPEGARLTPGEGYTVVEALAPSADDRPSPEAAEEARAFFAAISARSAPAVALETLVVTRAESEKPEENGQVKGAEAPLAAPSTGPVCLRFRLTPRQAHFYGAVGVWLVGEEGKSRLGVRFSRMDYDRDLPDATVRSNFLVRSDAEIPVAACSVPGLTVGETYEVLAGWDGRDTVRFALISETGEMLWESAALPFAGPLSLDRLALDVTPFLTSDIRTEGDTLIARGVSGGPVPSPYVLDAEIRDLELAQPR